MRSTFADLPSTGKEIDVFYNRISNTGKMDFELEEDEDGSITFRNNPEFLCLFVGWLRKHNPKLDRWIALNMPPNTSNVSFRVAYDEGSRTYMNSPRRIKREMRKSRIQFNKWLKKNFKTKFEHLEFIPSQIMEGLNEH